MILITARFGFALSGKGSHILPCPNFRLLDDLEVLTAGAFSFLSLKPRICETSVQRASQRRSGASPGCAFVPMLLLALPLRRRYGVTLICFFWRDVSTLTGVDLF